MVAGALFVHSVHPVHYVHNPIARNLRATGGAARLRGLTKPFYLVGCDAGPYGLLFCYAARHVSTFMLYDNNVATSRGRSSMMRSGKAALLIISLISAVCLGGLGTSSPNQQTATSNRSSRPARTEGLDAWQQVYSVLTHPRCLNCHTATDYPQQGDDRHRHLYNVVRGPQGKGVAALNCVTCHQEANADTTGVPGGPDWHLAALSMQWQDANDNILPTATVCRAVTDRSKNGGL